MARASGALVAAFCGDGPSEARDDGSARFSNDALESSRRLKAFASGQKARAPSNPPPAAQTHPQGGVGRDHNGGTFTGWMTGAGVKPGLAHGASDAWSWKAAHTAASTYDFRATVLHLLGIHHEKLTFRHNGANRRLTDVHGEVIDAVLA